MSDAADDIGFAERQLLNKSKTHPLRERMRRFVEDRGEDDLKQRRRSVSEGTDLSEIVTEDRDERI